MNKIFITAFVAIIALFNPAFTQAQTSNQETISLLHSDITINQDTSITIKEIINYYAPIEKHGIYRYIPLKYRRDGIVYRTHIKDISVTTETGDHPFERTTESGNLKLKIGDPNKTFKGERMYTITYTVEDALKQFEDHDELYWDITGEGWQIPIENAHALIHSPHADITQIKCYSGQVGTNNELCTSSFKPKDAEFDYKQQINYGDNLTVVIGLAKDNQLQFPTTTEKWLKTLLDNISYLFILGPLLLMFLLWYAKGRDWVFDSPNVFNLDPDQPKHKKGLFEKLNTPFVYEPLKLTPGESGTILDEKTDNQDVIAEIIALASKKYLKIEKKETKKLFGKNTDYTFFKLKNTDSSLPKHQKYLMEKIFTSSDETKLSDLKGSFYNHIEQVKKYINQSLTQQQLFTRNPQTTRMLSIIITIIANGAALFMAIGLIAFLNNPLPIAIYILQAGISLMFAWNMPQKTAVGTNLMLQARGLKETLRLGKWRDEIKEKHLFLEEIIPYSIALGVLTQLASDMKNLQIEPPEYFTGSGLTYHNFAAFASDFSHQASSNLSYNPSSSSWSGGSGFSGGSSGGGGGGGGGGSW